MKRINLVKTLGSCLIAGMMVIGSVTPAWAAELPNNPAAQVMQEEVQQPVQFTDVKTTQASYDTKAQNKMATISYHLNQEASVVVQVYQDETWLTDLVLDETQSAGSHTVNWDYSGRKAGNYKFVVFSKDNGQTVVENAAFALITQSVAFTDTAASQASYDAYAQQKLASVTYTLNQEANVVVQVYQDQTWLADLVLYETQSAGSHTVQWDYSGKKTGNYKFVVFSKDNDETVIADAPFTLVKHSVIFTDIDTTQEQYDVQAEEKTASVSYALNREASVVVQVYQGDTWLTDLVLYETQSAGIHTVNWDYSGRKAGNYRFVVFSKDNEETVSADANFALTAQSVQFTEVASLQKSYDVDALNKIASLSYTLNQEANIVVQVYQDNTWITDLVLYETQNAGIHTVNWNFAGRKPGNYKFVVFSKDNNETVLANAAFELTAAAVQITNVKTQPFYELDTGNNLASVSYTLDKASNMVVQVYRGEQWLQDLVLYQTQASGTYTINWDYTGAQAGDYKFVIFTQDYGLTVSEEVTFNLKFVPVSITDVNALQEVYYTQQYGSVAKIAYTLNKPADIVVQVYKGNNWISDIVLYERQAMGRHTIEWNYQNAALGDYTFSVFAKENGQNVQEKRVSFKLANHDTAFQNISLNAKTFIPTPSTQLQFNFNLTKAAVCTVQVYTTSGKWIKDLTIDQSFGKGDQQVSWIVNNVPMDYYKVRIFTKVDGITLLTESEPFSVMSKQLYGVDVSEHNGNIDWNTVSRNGVQFAMIRTGYGKNGLGNQQDVMFERNYQGATNNGVMVGTYHFSYALSVEDAIQEAEFCLRILNGRRLDLPVAFDLEQYAQTDAQTNTNMTRAFCDRIAAAGYKPMIYASTSWLQDKLYLDQLGGIQIWEANWSGAPNLYGKKIQMWQKSGDKGSLEQVRIPGISTVVDTNIFYVDGLDVVRPGGNTEGTNAICVANDNLNIRTGPGTSYKLAGQIPPGAKLRVLSDAGMADGLSWYHIQYGDIKGYVAQKYVRYPA